MSRYEVKNLAVGTHVSFKNLLDEEDDICVGTVMNDGYVACECGCNGRFEADDIEVLNI